MKSKSLRVTQLEPRRLLTATLIADVNPTAFSSKPVLRGEFQGEAIYSAENADGHALLLSDGTGAETRVAVEKSASSVGAHVSPLGLFYETTFLSDDGTAQQSLWLMNHAGETERLFSTAVGDFSLASQSNPLHGSPTVFFDGRLFTTRNGNGFLVSDGTVAGTRIIETGPEIFSMVVTNDRLVAVGADSYGQTSLYWYRSETGDFAAIPNTKLASSYGFRASNNGDGVAVFIDGAPHFVSTDNIPVPLFPSDYRYAGTSSGYSRSTADGFYMVVSVTNGTAPPLDYWFSDGTPSGTVLVFAPGSTGSGIVPGPERNTSMIVTDDKDPGSTLWRREHTGGGQKIARWASTMYARIIGTAGGLTHLNVGQNYWVSDGTVEGTRKVADVDIQRVIDPPLSDGRFLIQVSGDVRNELWVTDLTEAGTYPLGENISIDRIKIQRLAQDLVVFAGGRGANNELWSTDGTVLGTRELVDFDPRTADAAFVETRQIFDSDFPWASGFEKLHGDVYFAARKGLYRMDAASLDTELIYQPLATSRSYVEHIEVTSERLFFYVRQETGQLELWTTNGEQEAQLLWEQADPGQTEWTYDPMVVGDRLYFRVPQSSSVTELWSSDGTVDGTELVFTIRDGIHGFTDFVPLPDGDVLYVTKKRGSSSLQLFSPSTGDSTLLLSSSESLELYRLGDVGILAESSNAESVWVSDGTKKGTRQIWSHDSSSGISRNLRPRLRARVVGDELLVSVKNGLIRTDGTVEGTKLVIADASPKEVDPAYSLKVGEDYYTWHGNRLMFGDGSEAGSRIVREFTTDFVRLRNSPMVESGGLVYFVMGSPDFGQELWLTDGTFAGTKLAADIHPGPVGSSPSRLTSFQDGILLVADDGLHGEEPWMYSPEREPVVDADINADGTLDFLDFAILSQNFGRTDAVFAEGDIDGDGSVGFADFLLLSANFDRN